MVGRIEELATLRRLQSSHKSEFVAIFGRRRVGKTYLIRYAFEDRFTFSLTGIANVGIEAQLVNFHTALLRSFPERLEDSPPKDWFSAFQLLISALESSLDEKKVIFLDELPWLHHPQSDFIAALEHFWNSWASARRDVLLLVCGSAASWMLSNLINNRGGLHNRITQLIHLQAFSLQECELFFQQKNIPFSRYQLMQLYMVLGGIPFYLELVEAGKSVAQNIDKLCFSPQGILRYEYDNLYASLFKGAHRHQAIVEAIAKKAIGLERSELLKLAKLSDGGTATTLLRELEVSGFIRKYAGFGKRNRQMLYQLSDAYSLFYLRFVKTSSELDKNFWINSIDSPEVKAWSGYAFEQLCLSHLDQIKEALGIRGVQSRTSSWMGEANGQKAQIDLVIDRRDEVINLCEMKFAKDKFEINKRYAEDLRRKVSIFRSVTETKKAIFLTLVSPYGLQAGLHQDSFQQIVTMEQLFA